MMNIAKALGVVFGVWMIWVAWEFHHSLRSLTSSEPMAVKMDPVKKGPPPLPVSKRLAMAVPIPQPQAPFLAAPAPEVPIPARFSLTAGEAADKFLQERKAELGIREYHEMRPVTYETPLGTKVKFSAYQDGLPILGSEITMEVSPDREVTLGENNYQPLKKADMSQPVLNYDQILERTGKYQLDMAVTAGISKLLYVSPGSDEPEVSYSMAVKDGGSGPTENLIFRASDGQILGRQVPRQESFPQGN